MQGVAQYGSNVQGYVISVQNGLTEITPGIAEWGGTLLHDTEIVQAGFTIKFGGGSFWSDGSIGDTPTSGTGTRLMWIPSKSAFRAGFDLFDAWNDANIGSYSLAGGYNNKASGFYSFAMGRDCSAAGQYSISLGATNSAQSDGSIGIGNTNVISVIDGIAIGRNITVNPGAGLSSYAFGSVIGVSANNAMCIGISQVSQLVNNIANSIFIGVGNTGKTTPDIVVIQGGVGIGNVTAPTARLHLQAGTASPNTSPLKFNSGISLTTPEAGAMEFDGTNLFFTPSSERKTIAFTTDTLSAIKITLSSAEILNLFTSPIDLLPAPGVGLTYEIVNIICRLNFVTSAYATNVNLTFRYSGGLGIASNNLILTSTDTRTGMIATIGFNSIALDQYLTNTPFQISVQTGNPTTGDGTLDIYLLYKILSL